MRKRLAVGGMGEVYLCRHRLLDRDDAVKVLRSHLVTDEAFRRRFLREALSAARLRHPHIVTVYTADEVDGQLYLAMEYIPGADLAAILAREQSIEPRRAVRLLEQVADALDAAHRLQLTHRDVKPSNVLVERPGSTDTTPSGPNGGPEHVYLVDFGLSKSAALGDQNITMTGQVLGTVAYIAPEQLQSAVTDGRSDQYALGCMAFECLTGRLPFPRENSVAVITAHLTTPPPAASDVMPSLPRAVDRMLAKAMAKDPRDRFATCTEFIAALRFAIDTGEPTVIARLAAPAGRSPHGGGSTDVRQEQAWANPATPAAAIHVDPSPVPVRHPSATGRVAANQIGPANRPASAEPVVSAERVLASEPIRYHPQHPSPTSGGGYRPGSAANGIAWPAGAPLPAGQDHPANSGARLYLAIIGGPDGGRLVPLPDGEQSVPIGRVNLAFAVTGWAVQVSADGESTLNGEPLHDRRQLAPGDLLTAGAALLEVRSGRHLARLTPNSPPPDPVTLERVARDRLAGAVRGPQHPQTLVTRIGWLGRRPPVPIAVPVGNAGGIAIRGSLSASVPLVRWLLAQAAVLHDARDLCLATALSPGDTEHWDWVATLPHARSGIPPLPGPHTATARKGALDLTARLRRLVEIRRAAAADPQARQLVALPRVIAILDDRLGGLDAEFLTAAGGGVGVHVVRLLPLEARPPTSCRLCIDLAPNGTTLTVWVAGRPGAQNGVADGVSTTYVREIAALLAAD